MSAFLSPIFGAGWQCFDNQGRVLNGGFLNTYLAGSVSTPQATWTTSTQTVQNANPIQLTPAGRFAQEIWLQAGVGYKFVLTDSALNVIGTWDNLIGVNDTTASQTEWQATNLAATFVNATTFTVPGNQTNVYTVNRRVQASVSAGTVYGYVVSATYNAPNTTVVVVIDSGSLDSGLTIVNAGLLNATNPSVPQSYLRTGVTIGGAILLGKSASIAAAATTDLSTATGNEVHITGNGGPIASFGVVGAGAEFTLIFDSNPTVTNSASLLIPGAGSVTVAAGDVWRVVSEGAGNWRVTAATPTGFYPGSLPSGTILDYGGAAPPTGYLACDGSAVSRTTYSGLFTALGTTWGAGDGSTTFNVPDLRGKVTLGAGTAVVSEVQATSVAANAQVVSSNNAKWVTGQTVRVSSSGSLPTGLSAATDYFLVRVDATHVSFASTLANAQNGTVITITGGSGNLTITTAGAAAPSYAAHALAETGGEEKHAMSSTELLAFTLPHSHAQQTGSTSGTTGVNAGFTANVVGSSLSTQSSSPGTGGNAAANVMTTFGAVTKIIKT
jgi:microcystin-dependent protein